MGAYICGGVGTVLAIAKNKQEKPEDSDLARDFFPQHSTREDMLYQLKNETCTNCVKSGRKKKLEKWKILRKDDDDDNNRMFSQPSFSNQRQGKVLPFHSEFLFFRVYFSICPEKPKVGDGVEISIWQSCEHCYNFHRARGKCSREVR